MLPAFREAMAEPKVRAAACVDDEEGFGHLFDEVFEGKVVDHYDSALEFCQRYSAPRPARPPRRLANDPPRR